VVFLGTFLASSRLRGSRENMLMSYEIYSFLYCPSVSGVLCAPVGTFVDTDGTKIMAVGAGIEEPYYVRFQKASTFTQNKNQDLSSV
jgi:hypothetical protein